MNEFTFDALARAVQTHTHHAGAMSDPSELGFAFRMGPRGNQECCGAPVGCTRTHPGCSFLGHEWKRDVVFRDPDARCTATAVVDNPDGTREWLRCTRRHHDTGGHVTAVVKTTTMKEIP